MTEKEMRELDAWIAEHVMGWTRVAKIGMLDHSGRYHYREDIGEVFIHKKGNEVCYFHPTTDHAAAMMVLEACYRYDRNSCLASLHNFLMRKEHDASFTPLQICLFAKQLFSTPDSPHPPVEPSPHPQSPPD